MAFKNSRRGGTRSRYESETYILQEFRKPTSALVSKATLLLVRIIAHALASLRGEDGFQRRILDRILSTYPSFPRGII